MRRPDYDYPHGDIPRIPLEMLTTPRRVNVLLMIGIGIAAAMLIAGLM